MDSFKFKQFAIEQDRCTMKVGTDGILLGAWSDVSDASAILDIGTGSGLIAIMLAQRADDAVVHAVEINEAACSQAAENMACCPWSGRMKAFPFSIQDYARRCEERYDLIVSNPPFFSGGTFSNSQDKNSVRHTVKLPHGDLLNAVRTLLHPKGRFSVILPHIEGLRFREMAGSYGLKNTRMTQVRPLQEKPVERLLLQFEKKDKPLLMDELIIQEEGANNWTEPFRALTGAFYLDKQYL